MDKQQRDFLATIVSGLPFVESHGIEVVSAADGKAFARMPFKAEHSTPPMLFPASIVGMLGDVTAIAACISAQKPGTLCATLDFTVKMTGAAEGDYIEAEGVALQSGSTTAVGEANIFAVRQGERRHCAVVLATGRVIASKTQHTGKDRK